MIERRLSSELVVTPLLRIHAPEDPTGCELIYAVVSRRIKYVDWFSHSTLVLISRTIIDVGVWSSLYEPSQISGS
jgi:hypothetical protein